MYKKVEGRQEGRPVLAKLLMKKSTLELQHNDTVGKSYSLVTEKLQKSHDSTLRSHDGQKGIDGGFHNFKGIRYLTHQIRP